jgi:hypothetical protein
MSVICHFTHTHPSYNEDIYVYVYFVISSWKDLQCPFRTDKRVQLKKIPTLMVWGQSEKIVEAECSNPELVSMLFELP